NAELDLRVHSKNEELWRRQAKVAHVNRSLASKFQHSIAQGAQTELGIEDLSDPMQRQVSTNPIPPARRVQGFELARFSDDASVLSHLEVPLQLAIKQSIA